MGGVGPWLSPSVAGPVPNRLRGLESGRYCPVWSERPGQDRVRLSAALSCLSDVIDSQLQFGWQLCMVSTLSWSGWEPQPIHNILCPNIWPDRFVLDSEKHKGV